MEIRRIEEDDADAIARILACVAEERVWIGTQPPVNVAARAERIRDELATGRSVGWVVVEDGEVVGSLDLRLRERDPAVATIGMALVPEARGRGGGKLLLQTALRHAAETGMHKLDLEVWLENTRAIGLYAANGFQVEGIRRDHYLRDDGGRRSTLVMARFI